MTITLDVSLLAASLGAIVWTSDPDDVHALSAAQDAKPAPVIRTV